MVFFNTGRDLSKYTIEEWLSIVQTQGVGEVLLTSIDKDGLSKGIDINLIKIARSLCDVPLIYSGGVNKISHIENIFNHNFEACAIASALHFNNFNTRDLKNDLVKKISDEMNEKISLATVYNTVHAFQKKGHLKEIAINSDKTYYDTNTSIHHHFYDEDTHELIDCDENDIDSINLKKNIPGKQIKSLEVLIKVASDNQNQN